MARISIGVDVNASIDVERLAAEAGHRVVHRATGATWVEIALDAARAVQDGSARAALLGCRTGTGMALVANRVPGVRAAVCTEPDMALSARVFNHANVLVLSETFGDRDLDAEVVETFFRTPFGAETGDTVEQIDRLAGRQLPSEGGS